MYAYVNSGYSCTIDRSLFLDYSWLTIPFDNIYNYSCITDGRFAPLAAALTVLLYCKWGLIMYCIEKISYKSKKKQAIFKITFAEQVCD